MRFTLSFLLISLNLSVCFAWQFPSEEWHRGEIILNDLSVRKGELKYDLDREAVQIRANNRTETYDASQISSFVFIQKSANALRTFYSVPYKTESGYIRPIFFERFIEGKMTLLGREYVAVTSLNNGLTGRSNFRNGFNNPNGFNVPTTTFLAFKLYFANDKGQIFESTGRTKDIVSYFEDNHNELKNFIKKEKLKLDELADVAKLVRHYNNDLS
ncbi:MAG: hypothetical protein ACI9Z3_000328 [Roseivirga sp.]|jgi:hypothetical protein